MDKTRVFVSSTHDLGYLRRDLQKFISSLGYVPVLSDSRDLAIPYGLDILETCKWLVRSSDLFVLVIGGRYGHIDPGSGKSITHLEYETAYSAGMPICAFVESEIWAKRETYRILSGMVKDGSLGDDKMVAALGSKIERPEIFEFIEQVANEGRRPWIRDFKTADDIADALRNDWSLLFREKLAQSRQGGSLRASLDYPCPSLRVKWIDPRGDAVDVISVEPVPALTQEEVKSNILALRPSEEDLIAVDKWRMSLEERREISDLQKARIFEEAEFIRAFVNSIDEAVALADERFDEFCWRYNLRARAFVPRLRIFNHGTVPANGVVVILNPQDGALFCELKDLDRLSIGQFDGISRVASIISSAKGGRLLDTSPGLNLAISSAFGQNFELRPNSQRFVFGVEDKGILRVDLSISVKHNLHEIIDLKYLYLCPRLSAGDRLEIPYECHADNLPAPYRGKLMVVAARHRAELL